MEAGSRGIGRYGSIRALCQLRSCECSMRNMWSENICPNSRAESSDGLGFFCAGVAKLFAISIDLLISLSNNPLTRRDHGYWIRQYECHKHLATSIESPFPPIEKISQRIIHMPMNLLNLGERLNYIVKMPLTWILMYWNIRFGILGAGER